MTDALLDGQDLAPGFARTSDRLTIAAQKCRIAIETHLRDWRPDESAGIDYIGFLSVKPFPLAAVGLATRTKLKAVGEVQRIASYTQNFDAQTRTATFTFDIVINGGDTFTLSASAAAGATRVTVTLPTVLPSPVGAPRA